MNKNADVNFDISERINRTQESVIKVRKDYESLDNAIRGWIVMTNFEKDQENYQKLKSELNSYQILSI